MADIEAHLGGKKRGPKPGKKTAAVAAVVPAKYMDLKTGATWSGRGRAPAWIANAKNRTHLLIDGKAATASCSAAAKSVMTHETGYPTPKRIARQPPHARLASSSLNAPSCRCSMSARTSGSARRAAWRDDFGKAAHASSISPDRCSPIAASNTQA